MSVYLDTHIVGRLYSGERDKFSKEAVRLIENGDLLISPAVLLELRYLHDRKRVKADPGTVYNYLSSRIGLQICHLPFSATIAESLHIRWTSDPFDILIVANAIAKGNSHLITADRCILDHYAKAVC